MKYFLDYSVVVFLKGIVFFKIFKCLKINKNKCSIWILLGDFRVFV